MLGEERVGSIEDLVATLTCVKAAVLRRCDHPHSVLICELLTTLVSSPSTRCIAKGAPLQQREPR